MADNIYTFKSVKSGLCLDVPSRSTTVGVQVQQWTCNGGANQRWTLDLTGGYTGGNYLLVGVGSGLSIGVAGPTAQAAAVDQEPGGSASTSSEARTFSWPGGPGGSRPRPPRLRNAVPVHAGHLDAGPELAESDGRIRTAQRQSSDI
ncbi:RICIN domain-containing protein [Kitasatospora sp. DSM 101779]|uniref:RICIN domain-containing protein n=1 Tax=Kitasatospora sp. DSM 101779 TaxID=2853165 RepID=UPI0021DAD61B|nr:RICIN domain-containing protein [Kitasatospora sp. DSM 101779]